jgi:hypothetical protein
VQRFDLGQQTIAAQAPFVAGRHRNMRQFRAPAAGFLLAVHRGSALCATGFHRAMMAQLRRGVQRRVRECGGGFLVSGTSRMLSLPELPALLWNEVLGENAVDLYMA